jgi:hypothetical protein
MAFLHSNTLGGRDTSRGIEPFPDPFCDYASLAMPETLDDAFEWCEYIIQANGIYRSALDRVISFFITEVEITGADREEKEKYKDFLHNTIGIQQVLKEVALDFLCFHGDTLVPTRDGVFKIRELEGQTVDVLSQNSVYRPARFKKFGRQSLMEVTFSDGRTVLVTPEHQWLVKRHNSGELERVPTTALAGRRIPRTVAPRPDKDADYAEGVRHGFVFGDGSLYNKNCPNRTTMAVANFYGAKDKHLLPFFEGHGGELKEQHADSARYAAPRYKIHGLSAHYKELPEVTASASYWYGFVSGFLAADGSVDTYGCAVLTQKARATLVAIEAQLSRIGMCAGPIRAQDQTMLLPEYKGERREHSLTMHYMTLLKQFMQASDFIIPAHCDNYERHDNNTNYGKFIGVKSVESTAIIADVYCCVEHETHSFVIGNGVLTGNCYGNSVTSLVVPFRRNLSCPQCGFEAPLKQIMSNRKFSFQWSDFQFNANCPFCNFKGKWTHVDRRSTEETDLHIKRWNIKELDLLWDPYTEDVSHIWKIPNYYKQHLIRGHLHHLERAPWEVVQAIKHGNFIQFDDDIIYHAKEDTLCGQLNKGWGISRVLTNFRQAWYVQVLHRQNEAIALDYIIPFRVLTPAARSGGVGGEMNDPLLTMDLGGFAGQVNAMLRRRRRDPAAWNVLPYPLEYQMIGGEANNLAPFQLMDQGIDTLLNSVGVPVDFYKGNLQIQAAPAALRLLESNWTHLVHTLNRFTQWLVDKISTVLSWDEVDARLARPSHIDDLNRQLAKLQLMMGRQISQTTGLKSVGLEFEEEQDRMLEEEKYTAEKSTETQEELEAMGMGDMMASGQMGAMPPGGAPGELPAVAGAPGQPAGSAVAGAPMGGAMPPPGGAMPPAGGAAGGPPDPNMPVDPVEQIVAQLPMGPNESVPLTELQSIADTVAQQIFQLPPPQRNSALRRVRQQNEAIHALVKSKIDQMESQAESQGRELAQQSAQQAAQGQVSMPPPM